MDSDKTPSMCVGFSRSGVGLPEMSDHVICHRRNAKDIVDNTSPWLSEEPQQQQPHYYQVYQV